MEMQISWSVVHVGTIYKFRLLNLQLHMKTSNETVYILCLMLVLKTLRTPIIIHNILPELSINSIIIITNYY
jgi:hypothetical protein